MAQSIIQTLNKIAGKPINYYNQVWLKENVKKLQIHICADHCLISIFDISDNWRKEGHIFVQEGNILNLRSEFVAKKEALSLIPYHGSYLLFLYLPPNKENNLQAWHCDDNCQYFVNSLSCPGKSKSRSSAKDLCPYFLP